MKTPGNSTSKVGRGSSLRSANKRLRVHAVIRRMTVPLVRDEGGQRKWSCLLTKIFASTPTKSTAIRRFLSAKRIFSSLQ